MEKNPKTKRIQKVSKFCVEQKHALSVSSKHALKKSFIPSSAYNPMPYPSQAIQGHMWKNQAWNLTESKAGWMLLKKDLPSKKENKKPKTHKEKGFS